ncbi:MAG: hypothetical protein D6707_05985 [Bacteroidetes bacterium]|nr:MAG: hypothetical protein D6707_05985 [Bacteroidota bacterium]
MRKGSLEEFLKQYNLDEVDILFVGETHDDPTIRYELGSLAGYLAKNGFKFYGAEAPTKRNGLKNEWGPLSYEAPISHEEQQKTYLNVVLKMCNAGIEPFPFDIRKDPEYSDKSREEQETAMANLIQEKIGRKKAVILVGILHTLREGHTIRSILENSGYRCLAYPYG